MKAAESKKDAKRVCCYPAGRWNKFPSPWPLTGSYHFDSLKVISATFVLHLISFILLPSWYLGFLWFSPRYWTSTKPLHAPCRLVPAQTACLNRPAQCLRPQQQHRQCPDPTTGADSHIPTPHDPTTQQQPPTSPSHSDFPMSRSLDCGPLSSATSQRQKTRSEKGLASLKIRITPAKA